MSCLQNYFIQFSLNVLFQHKGAVSSTLEKVTMCSCVNTKKVMCLILPLSCFILLNKSTPKPLQLYAFTVRENAPFQLFPYP